MSALIRQSHANNTEPLWLANTEGNNTIDGTLTVNGDIVTEGPLNSAGLIMKQQQHISILDANQNEVGRVQAGTFGTYPANSTMSIQCAPGGGGIGFGGIGGAGSSYIIPGATGGTDLMVVNGKFASSEFAQTAGQGAGSSFIPVGATNTTVNSIRVTANSRIFFTYYGVPSAGPGAGVSQGNLIVNPAFIVPGTSFRVDLTDANGVSVAASNTNVTFYWFIVN